MINTIGLSTPIHPAVLKDPPMSGNEVVVDLFGHITHTAVPCPIMQVTVLVPGARNTYFLVSC